MDYEKLTRDNVEIESWEFVRTAENGAGYGSKTFAKGTAYFLISWKTRNREIYQKFLDKLREISHTYCLRRYLGSGSAYLLVEPDRLESFLEVWEEYLKYKDKSVNCV